jgi:hypothetical protein
VHPFPKPGLRCDRRQRKKMKSHILTDSPIKGHIEQEAFASAAIEKKHCKGAKDQRNKKEQKNATKSQFLLQVNVFKKFSLRLLRIYLRHPRQVKLKK